jgi:hypothetical protein
VSDPAASTDVGPSAAARWLVGITLVLLLVPGLVGFDAWPLTAWRLFSLSRTDHQSRWVLDAVDADGDVVRVSLEDLPLRYRHAEWPMAELPGASEARQQAVCGALLDAVVEVRPDTVALRLVKERQTLVHEDGEYVVQREPTVEVTCEVGS